MKAVLVTYDLITPGQKYAPLIEKIKSFGGWVHIGGSVWLVSQWNLTAQHVVDELRTVLDDNDRLFAVPVKKADIAGWLPQGNWDWINSDAA